MKKLIILVFLLLAAIPPTAYASHAFDEVLSDKINDFGVFKNGKGIVYADELLFESSNSLFIVNVTDEAIVCEVYDDTDGIQLTDSISFPYIDAYPFSLSAVTDGGKNFLMVTSNISKKAATVFYTLENDTFTETNPVNYSSITYIAEYRNGKIISHTAENSVYNFLNQLKEKTIAQYSFANKISTTSDEELNSIRLTLSACADIMKFDIKSYDYDSLFKYILYTHRNFEILTDIPPNSGSSSSLGYNNVSVVNSEYIDFIMESIFRITPEKPPVNNLLTRGFCYNDGYYFYTGGFNVYFATEIQDILGIYDIGGEAFFTVFSDIYYEGDTKTPEYSFAILQKTDNSYSLLRLGMGENLPSQAEIQKYSPFSAYNNSAWENIPKTKEDNSRLLLPLLLLIISVGAVGLVCSIIVLIRMRRK